eukprot:jgi/Chrzof1/12638/Cz07g01310.t1
MKITSIIPLLVLIAHTPGGVSGRPLQHWQPVVEYAPARALLQSCGTLKATCTVETGFEGNNTNSIAFGLCNLTNSNSYDAVYDKLTITLVASSLKPPGNTISDIQGRCPNNLSVKAGATVQCAYSTPLSTSSGSTVKPDAWNQATGVANIIGGSGCAGGTAQNQLVANILAGYTSAPATAAPSGAGNTTVQLALGASPPAPGGFGVSSPPPPSTFGAPPTPTGATPVPFGTAPTPFGATPTTFGTTPTPAPSFGAAPAPTPAPFGTGTTGTPTFGTPPAPVFTPLASTTTLPAAQASPPPPLLPPPPVAFPPPPPPPPVPASVPPGAPAAAPKATVSKTPAADGSTYYDYHYA